MTYLDETFLTFDEMESIRLSDLHKLEQTRAAAQMAVSQPTFNRTLVSARSKIADALINGKAIKIEGGDYVMVEEGRKFACFSCNHNWMESFGTGRPEKCPNCSSSDVARAPEDRGWARKSGSRQSCGRMVQ